MRISAKVYYFYNLSIGFPGKKKANKSAKP
jgi:hypothetical protein